MSTTMLGCGHSLPYAIVSPINPTVNTNNKATKLLFRFCPTLLLTIYSSVLMKLLILDLDVRGLPIGLLLLEPSVHLCS